MTNNFKRRFFKILFYGGAGFVLLFLFRLAYGFTVDVSNTTNSNVIEFSNSRASSKKNYASKVYQVNNSGQSTVQVDQKYEKIADISTKSSEFESEEAKARKDVARFDALIQFEKKSGNKGNRRLHLTIGVPPENFDALYQELTSIGKVTSKQITKNDKTNEYKELNAKKNSLQKIRQSLIDLKSKGGKIEEYMKLENRILEIEQQLQDLGVSLGDFDDENEFCTVQFSLVEGKERTVSMLHRIKVAIEWTFEYYLMGMAIGFFLSLGGFLLLKILERLRVFEG